MCDQAVIRARHLVFLDNTAIVISAAVREFYVIAEKITFGINVVSTVASRCGATLIGSLMTSCPADRDVLCSLHLPLAQRISHPTT